MKKTVKLLVFVNFLLIVILFTFKPYDAKADTDLKKDLKLYICGIPPEGVMVMGVCQGPPVPICNEMKCAIMLPGPIIAPPND